jgi:UDP-N-acetylmuramoyl-tripeptide--D-alanyl-D-alanine ligase
LALICRPDFGAVLNIAEAHLEGLGTKEKVREAKLELADGLPRGSQLLLNSDDELLSTYVARSNIKVSWFGIEKDADFTASNLEVNGCGGYNFLYNGKLPVSLSILGRHQVYNALAALALCETMGADLEKAGAALSEFHPLAWRMELEQIAGLSILNDSYNANPDSMRAALATLAEQKAARRVACLGDMKELGEKSKSLHEKVGQAAASFSLDLLVAVGLESKALADSAIGSGMDAKNVFWFATQKEALDFLLGFVRSGDMVLVKASRGSGLDLLVRGLKEGFAERN